MRFPRTRGRPVCPQKYPPIVLSRYSALMPDSPLEVRALWSLVWADSEAEAVSEVAEDAVYAVEAVEAAGEDGYTWAQKQQAVNP